MAHTSKTVQAWLGYLFVEEMEALKMLAQSLPDNPVIVNIGAGGGTSCLAFKESRPDATVITIDIQDKSSPFGCLEGERMVMESAGYTLGSGWYQIHGDSKDIGWMWSFGDAHAFPLDVISPLVDLVFIDGDHSYKGAKGDIEAWLPNIKTGGLLAVHDYRKDLCYEGNDGHVKPHPQPWPGVDQAVDELLIGKMEQVMCVKSLIVFKVGK